MKFALDVLCRQKCSGHNPDRYPILPKGERVPNPTLAAARNSAIKGCAFCKIIVGSLDCFTKSQYSDSCIHFDSNCYSPSFLKVWLPDDDEATSAPSLTIELHIKGSSGEELVYVADIAVAVKENGLVLPHVSAVSLQLPVRIKAWLSANADTI
jgi:hypothetical protein